MSSMPYQNKSEHVVKKKNERDALARHLKMDRVKVSATARELVIYCNSHIAEDPLIFPVKENPFKDKKTCKIL